MARRDRNTQSTAEASEAPAIQEEVSVTAATEAEVPTQADSTDSTTEAPAQAEASTEAKAEEHPVDLTAFTAAVETAVAARDEATGIVAEADIAPVVAAYRDLEGIKAKNAGKNLLTERMKEAMNALDITTARAYMNLQENLSAGHAPKAEKAPADPTEAAVQKLATLDLARRFATLPEGVAADLDERVQAAVDSNGEAVSTYLAWLTSDDENKGDEPEVSALVRNAAKLAVGKAAKVGGSSRGTSTGERHDIGEHIRQAFESEAVGSFLTVAEIRNRKSTEYGDELPSAGAISARLFPNSGKCTLDFVEPGQNEKGNKGATKVA